MADGTRWRVCFDELDVPCDAGALALAFTQFDDRGDSRYAAVATELLAGLPRDDATAAHRFLLDARKPARRASLELEYRIGRALKYLRPHSRLYTPRSCWCLRQDWSATLAHADELLADTQRETWAVSSGDRWYGDQFGQLSVAVLSGYISLYRSSAQPRLEVARTDTTVTMTVGRGRHATTWTFTALTAAERTLADLVRDDDGRQLRAVGSWVRVWPEHVRAVMTDLGTGTRLRSTLPAAARHLMAAGPLTPDERLVVRALAPQWHASACELLSAAVAVAAGPTAR